MSGMDASLLFPDDCIPVSGRTSQFGVVPAVFKTDSNMKRVRFIRSNGLVYGGKEL